MEKLISMKDYVLEQSKIGMEVQSISHQHSNRAHRFEKIVKYANFLKKELNIGMFVPAKKVDGVWVVLEEPKIENDHHGSFFKMQTDFHKEKEYEEAKNVVLFKDFSFSRKPFEDFDFIKTEKFFVFRKHCTMKHWSINFRIKTVEDLVKYNLTFTQSAKQKLIL